jgi:hypothetical protein
LPECHHRLIFPDENAATGSHRLSRKTRWLLIPTIVYLKM